MDLEVRPLTPDLLTAFDDLFDVDGPAGRCWCMYWRLGPGYRQRDPSENRAGFHEVVEQGPPPGLLAFSDDLAVGWCQLTAREDLPWMDRSWRHERVDDLPVWSISCFYIRKGWRQKGVATALIEAAVKAARSAGAPALEAYPLDAELTSSTSFTGYLSTFERSGFEVLTRHDPTRPIVRIMFAGSR
ncbi:MAG TPA: GNAT family N-acetyltransferase [Acidimicrobiia bacterium]|nr:GNAT family N-acetyltransferase [Acidimicrobiia bacterium]